MNDQERLVHRLLYQIRTTNTAQAFNLETFCKEPATGAFFRKQYEFIKDPSKYKVACNSRRSGKTLACAGDLTETCIRFNRVNCAYITLSRLNAKQIIWRELLDLNQRYGLGARPNEAELTLTFPNGSLIYLIGAKDESEIEKIRGKAFKKVYIDEAQAFKSYLKRLIEDIITPALYDFDGSLVLIGTPGALKAGVFFDAFHGLNGFKGYSQHKWNIFDNPFLPVKAGKPVEQIVAEDLSRKGITKDEPSVQREIYGNWVEDRNSLVYKYDEAINTFDKIPDDQTYYHVLGVDVGFDDPDALVVWAYSRQSPYLYLVEEFQSDKQTISDLAAHIKRLDAHYKFTKKVMDSGGLGKKAMEELRVRHGIVIESADKAQKHAFIELMNDDFRRGIIKARRDLEVVSDWRLLSWDTDHNPPVEDDRFPNHLPDAALYGWREARHYAYKEKVKTNVDPEARVMQYWQLQSEQSKAGKEWWENA